MAPLALFSGVALRGSHAPDRADASVDDSVSVLLLGNYRPALTVARMLARDGYRIIMGTGGGEGCTEYSTAVSERWDHPALEAAGDAFADSLARLLAERPDIKFVYPVAEEFVRLLARRQDFLPGNVVLASPAAEVIDACADKLELLKLADALGLGGPPFCAIDSADELDKAAKQIGFPLVVRPLPPNSRLGHKKAIIANGPADLDTVRKVSRSGSSRLLLQGYASGERQDVFFAAEDGHVLRAMQARYLRTDHIDGTGLCVHGEVIALSDDLLCATKTMIDALGYTGIGCAQFVVDPATRKFCLLEINPRTSAIHRAPEVMGLDFSRLALALAKGGSGEVSKSWIDYRPGLQFAWSYGELRAIKSAFRCREVGPGRAVIWFFRMLRSAVRADVHLTWSWRDPLPTLMLFAAQLRRTGNADSAVVEADVDPLAQPESSALPSLASANTWQVVRDFSKAEAIWIEFEKKGAHTPFQRFAWLRSFHDIFGVSGGTEPAIVVAYAAGAPVALFPLCVKQALGVRRLEWLGQHLNDYNAPIILPDWLGRISPPGRSADLEIRDRLRRRNRSVPSRPSTGQAR